MYSHKKIIYSHKTQDVLHLTRWQHGDFEVSTVLSQQEGPWFGSSSSSQFGLEFRRVRIDNLYFEL